MNKSSIVMMAGFRDAFLRDEPLNILDVGSQVVNHPDQVAVGSYRRIFSNPKWKYTGADTAAGLNVDVVLRSQYHWQFADGEFDAVVSGQTMEHVEWPWVWLVEVARILKPGGYFCTIVPCMWREHRYPLDCYRYYPDGLRALCRWAKLLPIETSFDERVNVYQSVKLVAQKP